jgi:hypothetical protein
LRFFALTAVLEGFELDWRAFLGFRDFASASSPLSEPGASAEVAFEAALGRPRPRLAAETESALLDIFFLLSQKSAISSCAFLVCCNLW